MAPSCASTVPPQVVTTLAVAWPLGSGADAAVESVRGRRVTRHGSLAAVRGAAPTVGESQQQLHRQCSATPQAKWEM